MVGEFDWFRPPLPVFEQEIKQALRQAWFAEWTRALDEICGDRPFRPLGILNATTMIEPCRVDDYAHRQMEREAEWRQRAERNARAVAWWGRATGRSSCHDQPRDAPDADECSPSTAMATWSATPNQVRLAPLCRVSERGVVEPSIEDILQRELAVWESEDFWDRVAAGDLTSGGVPLDAVTLDALAREAEAGYSPYSLRQRTRHGTD